MTKHINLQDLDEDYTSRRRLNLALLGVVCPRFETGDTPGSLSAGEKQRQTPGILDGVTFKQSAGVKVSEQLVRS
jgi:hypothetical protein